MTRIFKHLLVANAHSGPNTERQNHDFLKWCMERQERPIFLSEAWNLPLDSNVHRATVGSKGRREVAIITAKEPQSVTFHQLTNDLNVRNAPDRWATVARVDNKSYIATHANAVIQTTDRKGWRSGASAREWHNKGIPNLESIIKVELDKKRSVFVGGDLNWYGDSFVKDSPAEMFHNLDMGFVNRELLWLAWSSDYRYSRSVAIPNPPGSDHIAMSVTLEKVI